MPVKIVRKVWLLAIISAGIAGFLLYHADIQRQKAVRGNFIFAVAEHLQDVKKVEIILPKNKLTIYQDENVWRVLEADNYYADFKILQNLQQAILNGKIKQAPSIDTKDLVWSSISLYNAVDDKLDEVEIANATEVGSHYIRYPHDEKIYLSNWQINLPDIPEAWTHQPLIDFNGVEVSAFQKNGVRISRQDEGTSFLNDDTHQIYRQYDYMKVFDALTNLWYEQVLSVQNFDEKKYTYHQYLQTETFDGLITEFDVYTDYNEYWVKVKISPARLSRVEVGEYVKNNAFLYQDWWFKLPLDIGRTLFMFRFNL